MVKYGPETQRQVIKRVSPISADFYIEILNRNPDLRCYAQTEPQTEHQHLDQLDNHKRWQTG